MNRNRILTLSVIVLVVAILGFIRYKRQSEKDNMPLLQPITASVQVTTVHTGQISSVEHVLGEVHGADEAAVASRIVSTIEEVRVREGQRVNKGQELVLLDPAELKDAVLQAEANLEAARVAHKNQAAASARDKILLENGGISQEEWERSQSADAASMARLDVAKTHLDQARTRMGYAVLRSPFDGVISARLADPGDLAVLGHPLLRVVRQNEVRVRAMVPPSIIVLAKQGTPADLDIRGGQLNLSVSRIFPAMEGSHLGTVEIDVTEPTPDLVVGATVGVDLHLRGGQGLLVPADALLEGTNGTHVFKLVDSGEGVRTVHVVDVTVVTRSLDEAIVEGELNEGDQVIVARPSRLMGLAEGMAVSPAR